MNGFLASIDAAFAVQSLQLGAGLLMALTALELLVRFRVYANGGLLSWELVRQGAMLSQSPFLRRLGDFFYREHSFRIVLAVRMLLGLGLMGSAMGGILSPMLLGAALLSSLLVLFRAGPGLDGSFQLRVLMLVVLFTCSISPWDSLPFRLGLYFLSAQLVLSYLLAGIAKLRGRSWRNGTGLIGILGTRYHGLAWAHRFLAKRPALSKLLSWGVISFEILFPLVLTGQSGLVVALLAFTTLFHLATSLMMGLNGFFLSFTAAYPALVYCLGQLAWVEW